MEIDGLLYRVELVQVVSNPGFERSNRKRKRQKKDPHLRKMGDKVRLFFFFFILSCFFGVLVFFFRGGRSGKRRGLVDW